MIKRIYKSVSIALTIALSVPLILSILQPLKVDALTGSGTSASPYIITTAADLDNVRNNTSAYYKLGADIDLAGYANWNPIPSFTGNFDGDGYTIKNLKINRQTTSYQGLFYELYNNGTTGNGTVKNLNITTAMVQGGQYTGVLAGKIRGTNWTYPAIVDNVILQGEVNTTWYNYIGGLTGQASSYVEIKNSTIDVKVTADNSSSNNTTVQNIGGVVGQGDYVKFTNIKSLNDVIAKTGTSYVGQQVGGIAGYLTYGELDGITNKGSVSVSSNNNFEAVGGLIGYMQYGFVKNSTNYASVDATGNGNRFDFGGILGRYYYGSGTTLNNLANLGNITITNANAIYQVGGIVGNNRSNTTDTMSNLTNSGDINATTSSSTALYYFGGIFGYYYASSSGTSNLDYSVNTGDITVKSTSSSSIYSVGGLVGYAYGYSSQYIEIMDNYNSGNIRAESTGTGNVTYYIGGLVGQTSNSNYNPQVSIYRNYNSGTIWAKGTNVTNSTYYPSGLVGYGPGAYMYYNYNLAPSITNAQNSGLYYYDGYNFSGSTGNYYINTLTGGVNGYSAGAITPTQSKTLSTYTGNTWSTSIWGNKTDGTTTPYLKGAYPAIQSITGPTMNQSFQVATIPLSWTDANSNSTKEYQIFVEKLAPNDTDWTTVNTYTSATTTYYFTVPAGTPGNTKFRWQVRGKNFNNVLGNYYPATYEFLFSNNVPTLTSSWTSAQKDLSTALTKRTMQFSLDSLVDPDSFNYVRLFAEIYQNSTYVTGSKKQILTDKSGPVNITSKVNYKLKLIPNFSATANNFDLAIVDSANESNIIATLIDDRPMQNPNDAAAESFQLRMYAEDYQNTLNTKLSTSTPIITMNITVDTRNYLPSLSEMVNDVNGRKMSANQGFNRIKFSGKVTDLDPADDVKVYYTVKGKNDLVAGKYAINPSTDTLIKSITSTGTGIVSTFETTYTVSDSLTNGDWVIVVYGTDHRGGIGAQTVINFTVDRTNPDIKFFAQYNGNTLSTAQRQIVAKDSKLKMYFSAYQYTTFEYAGYLVKANQQTSTGTYTDLKIRGAFTNDVPSKFIGVDLTDSLFEKGDMLVFKFRAISSTGVKIEKDVRVLIGDEAKALTDIADSKVPTALLTQN